MKKDVIDLSKLSEDEAIEAILLKAYSFKYDVKSGQVKLKRNGNRLSLDETAFMLWLMDGKKTKKPMSKMGMLKMQNRICQKIKLEMNKRGINDEELRDWMVGLSKTGRQSAACCDRVEDNGYSYSC